MNWTDGYNKYLGIKDKDNEKRRVEEAIDNWLDWMEYGGASGWINLRLELRWLYENLTPTGKKQWLKGWVDIQDKINDYHYYNECPVGARGSKLAAYHCPKCDKIWVDDDNEDERYCDECGRTLVRISEADEDDWMSRQPNKA